MNYFLRQVGVIYIAEFKTSLGTAPSLKEQTKDETEDRGANLPI